MNKYYVITEGIPAGLANSFNPPAGAILETIYADKTPARSKIENRAAKHGCRSAIRLRRADLFENKFAIEGDYYFKKA